MRSVGPAREGRVLRWIEGAVRREVCGKVCRVWSCRRHCAQIDEREARGSVRGSENILLSCSHLRSFCEGSERRSLLLGFCGELDDA